MTKLVEGLTFEEICFKDLAALQLRLRRRLSRPSRARSGDALRGADALLFVTPEQPLDSWWPEERNRLGKPALRHEFPLPTSRRRSSELSPGAIGTAVAQQSLRSVLSYCNSPQMNAPEAYIHFTPGLITDGGEVTVDSTEQFLRTFMTEFYIFIERTRRCPRTSKGRWSPSCSH